MVRKLLCWLGIYQWLTLRCECLSTMVCNIRTEARDRICRCCEQRDNRIAVVSAQIRAEEQSAWKTLQADD